MRSVKNRISIAPTDRAKPGVKIRRHFRCMDDCDVSRQRGIERFLKCDRRHLRRGMEIGDLTGRMYPPVRAPRPNDLRLRSGNLCKRILNGPLNRYRVGLDLPAMIVCAIVFDSELDISHCCLNRGYAGVPIIPQNAATQYIPRITFSA